MENEIETLIEGIKYKLQDLKDLAASITQDIKDIEQLLEPKEEF